MLQPCIRKYLLGSGVPLIEHQQKLWRMLVKIGHGVISLKRSQPLTKSKSFNGTGTAGGLATSRKRRVG
jgi:hypothetical protein